jgi:hypothetical protein
MLVAWLAPQVIEAGFGKGTLARRRKEKPAFNERQSNVRPSAPHEYDALDENQLWTTRNKHQVAPGSPATVPMHLEDLDPNELNPFHDEEGSPSSLVDNDLYRGDGRQHCYRHCSISGIWNYSKWQRCLVRTGEFNRLR